jgi:transcriptional regulator with XRE-family HTH domain
MTGQELNTLVGKNIRRYRKEKLVTQKKLANEIGVSSNVLSDFENGKHLPSCRNLALLGFALNVDVWRLFYTEGEEKLRPCRFCKAGSDKIDSSGELVSQIHPRTGKITIHGHHVTCLNCGASGPKGKTQEESIALWNK